MKYRADELIQYCRENNMSLRDVVVEDAVSKGEVEETILSELDEMYQVMKKAANNTLDHAVESKTRMIDGFAYNLQQYKSDKSLCSGFMLDAMSMAFSTLETSADMGKIVASPTAGSSGVLPGAFIAAQNRYGFSDEEIVDAMLVSVGVGQMIGYYGTFAGAEGGCQAECGSAAAMAAGGLVHLLGGSVEACLHGASIAIVNILGLVCDPVAGLVEYPCTFRNASGVMNAIISADMALAGIYSAVPFDEVCITLSDVGKTMPPTLRETAKGGLAITPTGEKANDDLFGKNPLKQKH